MFTSNLIYIIFKKLNVTTYRIIYKHIIDRTIKPIDSNISFLSIFDQTNCDYEKVISLLNLIKQEERINIMRHLFTPNGKNITISKCNITNSEIITLIHALSKQHISEGYYIVLQNIAPTLNMFKMFFESQKIKLRDKMKYNLDKSVEILYSEEICERIEEIKLSNHVSDEFKKIINDTSEPLKWFVISFGILCGIYNIIEITTDDILFFLNIPSYKISPTYGLTKMLLCFGDKIDFSLIPLILCFFPTYELSFVLGCKLIPHCLKSNRISYESFSRIVLLYDELIYHHRVNKSEKIIGLNRLLNIIEPITDEQFLELKMTRIIDNDVMLIAKLGGKIINLKMETIIKIVSDELEAKSHIYQLLIDSMIKNTNKPILDLSTIPTFINMIKESDCFGNFRIQKSLIYIDIIDPANFIIDILYDVSNNANINKFIDTKLDFCDMVYRSILNNDIFPKITFDQLMKILKLFTSTREKIEILKRFIIYVDIDQKIQKDKIIKIFKRSRKEEVHKILDFIIINEPIIPTKKSTTKINFMNLFNRK